MGSKRLLILIFFITLGLGVIAVAVAIWLRRPEETPLPGPSEAEEVVIKKDVCCLEFPVSEKKLPLSCEGVFPRGFSVRPGESKNLKALAAGGKAPYVFKWVADGGKLSSKEGEAVTWTAPSDVVAKTVYVIKVSVTDAQGKVAESEKCRAEATVSVTPAVLSCASLSASLTSGDIPLRVSFSATAESTHEITSYEFDFGDGNTEQTTSGTTYHTYTKKGVFTAKVRMRDSEGNWTADTWGDVLGVCTIVISATKKEVSPEAPPAGEGGQASPPAVPDTGVLPLTLFLFGFGLVLVFLGARLLVGRSVRASPDE